MKISITFLTLTLLSSNAWAMGQPSFKDPTKNIQTATDSSSIINDQTENKNTDELSERNPIAPARLLQEIYANLPDHENCMRYSGSKVRVQITTYHQKIDFLENTSVYVINKSQWTPIQSVQVGDQIQLKSGEVIEIEGIEFPAELNI